MKNIKRTKNKALLLIIIFVITFALIFSSFFCVKTIVFPTKYQNIVESCCKKYNIDTSLVFAIIKAESNFKSDAVSSKGAIGLMQIMPSTAIFIAENLNYNNFKVSDLFLPQVNINFGTYYLKYLKEKFGNLDTVICSYNAGETVVKKWLNNSKYSTNKLTLKLVPYSETSNYLKKVNLYKKIYTLLS